MIDTIELRIAVHPNRLTSGPGAGMPSWTNHRGGSGHRSYYLDSSRLAPDEAYYPLLSGTFSAGYGNRRDHAYINIRFSAPKLIHGNNLMELNESDADRVLTVLSERLRSLGFEITPQRLANAAVKTVHYSKNIELVDGITAARALADIRKVNLTRRLIWKEIQYGHGGESVAFSSGPHRIVIYNKIADMMRTNNNADLDPLPTDRNIANLWAGREVLRLEVQINNPRKISSVFAAHGWNQQPSFTDVFSRDKSQAILLDYWGQYIAPDVSLFAEHGSPHEMLRLILRSQGIRTQHRVNTALTRLALIVLANEPNGLTRLREMLHSIIGNVGWYRMLAIVRQTSRITAQPETGGWYSQSEAQLGDFQQIAAPEAGRSISKDEITKNSKGTRDPV